MGGVERITQIDETRTHWVTNIDGVKREFDAEITEQHVEERVAWTSTSGDAKHAGVVTFHRLDDAKTRVMIQIDWEPQGLRSEERRVGKEFRSRWSPYHYKKKWIS